MNYEKILEEIRDKIKEGDQMGLTPEEVILDIEQLLPTKTVFVPEPKKTSQDRLDYLKQWRKDRKRLEELQNKIGTKEEKERLKVEKAKKRTGFFCYGCKKAVIVDSSKNEAEIINPRSHLKKKILIFNLCPHCNEKVVAFGGYLA